MLLADENLGPITGTGLGPFGKTIPSGTNAVSNVLDAISKIIGILTVFASIWFLLQILLAGYEWMSAGGDTKKIASARDRITHAFIGLIIVVGAWTLVAVTGQFLGFNTLVDPNTVIKLKLGP